MDPDPFVAHRNLLFTVAYEMLGSAADAEDVVQEAWLRWAAVDHDDVRDPRAYVVRIVTRLALDRLRALSRRREDYVGEWLPEPLLTTRDVADDVELAESVSIAMLTVLETLSPRERAVFVLREVFDLPYDEIAEVVDRTEPAVRQIAHRARKHVAARRPRMSVTLVDQEAAVESFRIAIQQGDLQRLLDVLAADAVLVTDGGGLAPAFRQPIAGAQRVAERLIALAARVSDPRFDTVWLNGSPALILELDGRLDTAIGLAVQDRKITRIYAIRNPLKLSRLGEATRLSRTVIAGPANRPQGEPWR